MLLIALVNPHVLLLDEPTNHLDMQLGQDGSVWLSGSQTEESFGVFCLATFFTAKAVAAGVTMSSQVAD
jgi:ABC-type sulfate/molybdate transport systems ATPase subunit